MANKNQWDSKVNDTSLRDEIDNLYEAIPSYVEVDVDDIQEDQRAIAFKLADQLNTLKDFLDAPQKIEPGATYSLSGDEDETWPEDAAAYKQSGPVVLLLLENLSLSGSGSLESGTNVPANNYTKKHNENAPVLVGAGVEGGIVSSDNKKRKFLTNSGNSEGGNVETDTTILPNEALPRIGGDFFRSFIRARLN